MENESFDFNKLFEESKNTLLNPKEYFTSMVVTGGLVAPVIKAAVYGLIAGLLTFVWSLFHLGGATSSMIGGAVGFMAIIFSIIGALVGLFIGAIILMILSAIAKGSTDFEANVRVSASLLILMPLSSLFSFFSGFNLTLGAIVSLLINLYGLWLLYNALTTTLKGDQRTSKIVTVVLAALVAIMFIAGFGARKKAADFFGSDNYKEMEQLQKEMKESIKDLEKEAKKLNED